jgi:hypothetical protein
MGRDMIGDCRGLLNVLFQISHSGAEENEKRQWVLRQEFDTSRKQGKGPKVTSTMQSSGWNIMSTVIPKYYYV